MFLLHTLKILTQNISQREKNCEGKDVARKHCRESLSMPLRWLFGIIQVQHTCAKSCRANPSTRCGTDPAGHSLQKQHPSKQAKYTQSQAPWKHVLPNFAFFFYIKQGWPPHKRSIQECSKHSEFANASSKGPRILDACRCPANMPVQWHAVKKPIGTSICMQKISTTGLSLPQHANSCRATSATSGADDKLT